MSQHRSQAENTARTARIKQMQSEYRKKAKKANQRLRRLEKHGGPILQFAYSRAVHDTQALFGKNRFSYAISSKKPEDVSLRDLTHYITVVDTFLNAVSSTISGLRAVYNRTAEKINNEFDLGLDADTMGEFYESSLWRQSSRRYGSRTAHKIIGNIRRGREEMKQEFDAAKRQHRRVSSETLQAIFEGTPIDIADASPSDIALFRKVAEWYFG